MCVKVMPGLLVLKYIVKWIDFFDTYKCMAKIRKVLTKMYISMTKGEDNVIVCTQNEHDEAV